ncbi:MAG: hypothetical protein M3O01_13955 [Pseudomonadota bacterium]|nr:hypothetical protein [Pseudomonadota bacterium]
MDTLACFGPLPRALADMLTDAAVRQLDSEMIIRQQAEAPSGCLASASQQPTSAAGHASKATLHDHELADAERVLAKIRTEGLACHFRGLMRAFARFMLALFFSPAQQARALAWTATGRPFTFLSSDRGGPALDGWRTIARPTATGTIRLTVAKVWAIEAHRDALAVIVSRLPGVSVPAAYLVGPESYRQLVRHPCGAPFLEGMLQLADVEGEVELARADRLGAGSALMMSRYLATVRPFFVRALMAHVQWLTDLGRIRRHDDIAPAVDYLQAAAFEQSRCPDTSVVAIHRSLALKFASNAMLQALVRGGSVLGFGDQRDLLAFTKMEGSCYRCYHELYRAAHGRAGRPFASSTAPPA